MNGETPDDNPYLGSAREEVVESREPRARRSLSLTEIYLVAQIVVVVLVWIWDPMRPGFVLPYAFVLLAYVRAIERSLLESAEILGWRAQRSASLPWVFSAVAALGAWPFVAVVLDKRPGALVAVLIIACAVAGPVLAGLRTWASEGRATPAALPVFGPLLAQSLLAAAAVGFTMATIVLALVYYVFPFLAVAPGLVTVVLLASAYAVVRHAPPLATRSAAYRTASSVAVVVAVLHLGRAVLPFELSPRYLVAVLAAIAVAAAVGATRGREVRRPVFAGAALVAAASIAVSGHWLDTIMLALLALVLATAPLLETLRGNASLDLKP